MPNCPTCGHRLKASNAAGLAFPKLGKRKGRGCRLSDRDEAAKERLGYVEAGSYVRRDGSEKLAGGDWGMRVEQLRFRASGRCEMSSILDKPHAYDCHGDGDDPHHVIKRSTRRDDRLSNLALLSRPCHDALGPRWGNS